MSKLITLLIAISLSAITVLADAFIKKASLGNSLLNKYLLLGAMIYGLTGIGWYFVMKNMKLSMVGVVYGISCIAILAIVSVVIFHEKINLIEVIGILLGIFSIMLLYRFA